MKTIIAAILGGLLCAAAHAAGRPAPAWFTADCDKGQSVQELIDRAEDPTTIEVEGVCRESILIRGKNEVRIVAGPAGAAFTPPLNTVAFLIEDAMFITIQGVDINGFSVARYGSRVSLVGNRVENTTWSNRYWGWVISDNSSAHVTGNAFHNHLRGALVVQRSSSALIEDNEFFNNGLWNHFIVDGGTVQFSGNHIEGGGSGMYVAGHSLARLTGPNTFKNLEHGISCVNLGAVSRADGQAQTFISISGDVLNFDGSCHPAAADTGIYP